MVGQSPDRRRAENAFTAGSPVLCTYAQCHIFSLLLTHIRLLELYGMVERLLFGLASSFLQQNRMLYPFRRVGTVAAALAHSLLRHWTRGNNHALLPPWNIGGGVAFDHTCRR